MRKRWLVLLSTLLLGFVVGCDSGDAVEKLDETEVPPMPTEGPSSPQLDPAAGGAPAAEGIKPLP